LKTLLLMAALIVVAAILALVWWLAVSTERARKFDASKGIDPRLHADLVTFVRGLYAAPESLDADAIVVLPPGKRTAGEALLSRVAEDEATKMRAHRRRVGY
jgi:hypothetical protein